MAWKDNKANKFYPSPSSDTPEPREQKNASKLHNPEPEYHHRHADPELEISGAMTLSEVSQKYAIPVTKLTEALNVPSNQAGEKIGRLKKRYHFEMDELRSTVTRLKKGN
ncbi:hypothetical protein [Gaoshiqia sediminis]|uniref:Uncharacterized protein n=1 Tax=Gaoshiqia sediminis TaxID=2986998 RepID=A0AA41YBA7_9BACT|nr:hypothetical protein [Gaoshiqia sediminis]MCW0484912.1 hypothetical protein [Gaoshiqia sediminis]